MKRLLAWTVVLLLVVGCAAGVGGTAAGPDGSAAGSGGPAGGSGAGAGGSAADSTAAFGDSTASSSPAEPPDASSLASAIASMHPVAADELTIGVANGTSLPVTIEVNGTAVRTVAPGASEEAIPASALPALPWRIEARSPSGRVLASYTVYDGDVMVGPGSSRSVGNRADLSCGRLDVWTGAPMLGPAPGPGTPGDCEP